MTYFVLPHVYEKILPGSINIKFDNINNINNNNINQSLINYLKKTNVILNTLKIEYSKINHIIEPYEELSNYISINNKKLNFNKTYFKLIEIIKTFDIINNNNDILMNNKKLNCVYFTEADENIFINAINFFYNNICHNYFTSLTENNIENKIHDVIFCDLLNDTDEYNENKMLLQIFKSLSIQRTQGTLILKVFNFFSKVKQETLYMLSMLYDNVYIYKPTIISQISSEKYIICKSLKQINNLDTISNIIFNKIVNSSLQVTQLINFNINKFYLNMLIEANSILGQQQLENMNSIIIFIEQINQNNKLDIIKTQNNIKCINWCKIHGV